jgi:membrane protease YdiL (CAAX protease family)
MAPMFVSLTEPKTTLSLLVTPMVNTTLIIRDVLTGHGTAQAFLIAFASSTLYAGLMLSLASRLFSTEDLVNTAWEPLSLKGLRQGMRKKARLPALDEALALFALQMLLLIYISPSFMRWGFLGVVAGNELLLIALPTLLFARLMRYPWRETFAWRPATGAELIGAALIGAGVLPWVYGLAHVQELFWKPNPETAQATLKLLYPALAAQPVVTALAVGLLAGVCEELFYRGPLQTALARRLPAALALLVGAFLFAAAHLDVQGLLFRTLLGVLLGWIVLRGGSLFPAIVLHTTADAVHFGILAWGIHTYGGGAGDPMAAVGRFQAAFTHSWPAWLAAGALLILLGALACAAAWRRRDRESRTAEPAPSPLAGESAI